LTPTEVTNPETYLGTDRSQYMVGSLASVGDQTYVTPSSVPLDYYALGGTWHSASEDITAVRNARLTLAYQAKHIYLVLGGHGTVRVLANGAYVKTFTVTGFPTLYTLLNQTVDATGVVTLKVSAGVSAYDFTFG
jgi:hypothetical protein